MRYPNKSTRYNKRRAERNAEKQNALHVKVVKANTIALKSGGREKVTEVMWTRRLWGMIKNFLIP